MSADPKQFDRHLQPRERSFPKLALRQRTSDHPMVMFAVIVGVALASMALSPSSGFASIDISIVRPETGEPRTSAKADRLPLSETDIACGGQAWGAETEECLVVIARESGKHDPRAIRLVAIAEPSTSGPNIY